MWGFDLLYVLKCLNIGMLTLIKVMKIYCNRQQLHIPSHVTKGKGVIPSKHKTKYKENN
jgi:hypothetical protein